MAYDLGNLSNVTNYLNSFQGYVPHNGSMNMPSQGWDGWNGYNANTNYSGTPPAQLPPLNNTITNLNRHINGHQGPNPSRPVGDTNINPHDIYKSQYQSTFRPYIQARNNYPLLSTDRQNYGNYLSSIIHPLMQQYQWNGQGTAPTLPTNIPSFNPAQTYGGLANVGRNVGRGI
jgi:hypothetical protein